MRRFSIMWLPAMLLACSNIGRPASEAGSDATVPSGGECGEVPEGMTCIAASVYFMGSSEHEGLPRERPLHPVTFERPFLIDTFEVTNAQFAEFLREHGNVCSADGVDYQCYDCSDSPDLEGDRRIRCEEGWPLTNNCQSAPGGETDQPCADHPVSLVFWPGARAYCEWAGKRLPSESEWERAANGPGGPDGSNWQRFPWGSDCPVAFNDEVLPGCTEENWKPSTAKANCDEPFCNDGYIWMAPIGSFPAGVSPEGVHDLAGNAMEWVEDCFHESFAPEGIAAAPADGSAWVTDCDPIRRVATGGSMLDNGSNLRAAYRGGDRLTEPEADPDVGFRCAVDVSSTR